MDPGFRRDDGMTMSRFIEFQGGDVEAYLRSRNAKD